MLGAGRGRAAFLEVSPTGSSERNHGVRTRGPQCPSGPLPLFSEDAESSQDCRDIPLSVAGLFGKKYDVRFEPAGALATWRRLRQRGLLAPTSAAEFLGHLEGISYVRMARTSLRLRRMNESGIHRSSESAGDHGDVNSRRASRLNREIPEVDGDATSSGSESADEARSNFLHLRRKTPSASGTEGESATANNAD